MRRLVMGLVFLGALIGGCASTRVRVQYDETADFSAYKTFYFNKAQPKSQGRTGAVHDPLFNKDIMQEIRPLMEAKGFGEATRRDEADLLVVFYAYTRQHREFVPPTYVVGRRGRVWAASPGHVYNYKEGTLVIDIVDRAHKELVWRGVGTDVVGRGLPKAELVKAVEAILADFPPGKE